MAGKVESLGLCDHTRSVLTGVVREIIAFLAETVQPEKIFLLNHPTLDGAGATGYVDLLVVVPCRSHILFAEHQGLVEFSNLRSHQVVCSLHRSDAVSAALAQGHIHYSLSCTPNRLVYNSGDSPLPVTPQHLLQALREQATLKFEESYGKALAFYVSAQSCAHEVIGIFLLHQAAEMAYRAILHSLMDKAPHTHSIKALIKHSRRCTPQLYSVFPRDTPAEKQLVHQLEDAYLKARYEPGYSISPNVRELLFERVGKLLGVTRQVFDGKVKSFFT
ncbi:HEPN domain-containing protein [Rufibacter sp. LB8]|uniref:HEPN domain-containing protein n=1 Tax=Rufibacter sp. LB8 TaxID=2777781 RepID=UPI00178C5D37|nr:HEPN domain-containing protein [Rufibacter sp. LB8]